MKTRFSKNLGHATLGAALLAGLSACKEDQSAEVRRLSEQLDLVQSDFESQKSQAEDRQEDLKAANATIDDLKEKVSTLERSLRDAERELARFERKEEATRKKDDKTAASPRQLLAEAKEKVTGLTSARVAIAGDAASGTGVLVKDRGKVWIYAGRDTIGPNQKLEITTADGTILSKFGEFELAANAPIARLEVLDEGVDGVDLGEASAGGPPSFPLLVIDDTGDILEGRTFGPLGENGLRIDSKLGACPVGSPAFHGESAQLIGLVIPADAGENTLWSRAGSTAAPMQVLRLDTISAWTSVPIGTFLEETHLLDSADQLTRVVRAVTATTTGENGLNFGALDGGGSARDFLEKNGSAAEVKALLDLDGWLRENAGRSSEADINRKVLGAYKMIELLSARQSKELGAQHFSDATAERAKQSLKWREEAEAALADLMKDYN